MICYQLNSEILVLFYGWCFCLEFRRELIGEFDALVGAAEYRLYDDLDPGGPEVRGVRTCAQATLLY